MPGETRTATSTMAAGKSDTFQMRNNSATTTNHRNMAELNNNNNNNNNNRDTVINSKGIFENARFCHAACNLLGCVFRLQTKDGKTFEGILQAYNKNFEVALGLVHEIQPGAGDDDLPHEGMVHEKMIFSPDCIVTLSTVADLDAVSKGFATDTEISRFNGELQERHLEAWEPDEHDHEHHMIEDGDYSGRHGTGGWTVEEMFERNSKQFNVVSTFKEDLKQFSNVELSLDESSPEYLAKLAEAERIARSIEANPASKKAAELENDDEERDIMPRSSVSSVDSCAASVASATASTNAMSESSNRYLPPNKRRGGAQGGGRLNRGGPQTTTPRGDHRGQMGGGPGGTGPRTPRDDYVNVPTTTYYGGGHRSTGGGSGPNKYPHFQQQTTQPALPPPQHLNAAAGGPPQQAPPPAHHNQQHERSPNSINTSGGNFNEWERRGGQQRRDAGNGPNAGGGGNFTNQRFQQGGADRRTTFNKNIREREQIADLRKFQQEFQLQLPQQSNTNQPGANQPSLQQATMPGGQQTPSSTGGGSNQHNQGGGGGGGRTYQRSPPRQQQQQHHSPQQQAQMQKSPDSSSSSTGSKNKQPLLPLALQPPPHVARQQQQQQQQMYQQQEQMDVYQRAAAAAVQQQQQPIYDNRPPSAGSSRSAAPPTPTDSEKSENMPDSIRKSKLNPDAKEFCPSTAQFYRPTPTQTPTGVYPVPVQSPMAVAQQPPPPPMSPQLQQQATQQQAVQMMYGAPYPPPSSNPGAVTFLPGGAPPMYTINQPSVAILHTNGNYRPLTPGQPQAVAAATGQPIMTAPYPAQTQYYVQYTGVPGAMTAAGQNPSAAAYQPNPYVFGAPRMPSYVMQQAADGSQQPVYVVPQVVQMANPYQNVVAHTVPPPSGVAPPQSAQSLQQNAAGGGNGHAGHALQQHSQTGPTNNSTNSTAAALQQQQHQQVAYPPASQTPQSPQYTVPPSAGGFQMVMLPHGATYMVATSSAAPPQMYGQPVGAGGHQTHQGAAAGFVNAQTAHFDPAAAAAAGYMQFPTIAPYSQTPNAYNPHLMRSPSLTGFIPPAVPTQGSNAAAQQPPQQHANMS